ncbi:MAG TPA: lantibiotic dehydratase [Ktedonobacteraceae bacterium]|nr:lantibiotic dehydratase [Ktedonobacteraceae bacterium]
MHTTDDLFHIHQRVSLEEDQQTEAQRNAHLLHFAETPWAFWRELAVRGAGFPFQDVLKLAIPECTPAIEQLLHSENAIAQKVEESWQELGQQKSSLDTRYHRKVVKSLQRLSTELVPMTLETIPENLPTLQELADLIMRYTSLRQTLQKNFEAATGRVSQALSILAQDKRYREAILWQNRGALHRGIDALLPGRLDPERRSSSRNNRRDEAFLASYIQRYCTKNDSIGFFGPVGWGSFSTSRAETHFQPGASFLEARQIYFEHWCIEAIAELLAQDSSAAPWLKPRRMPTIRIEQERLILPFTHSLSLSPQEVRVLSLCDGVLTASAIAHRLLQEYGSLFRSVDEIYTLLHSFRKNRRICWTFEISLLNPYPERELRSLLTELPDIPLRNSSLSLLDKLEQKREAIGRAAGDPAQLDQEFSELENAFVQLTNLDPTRASGQIYAGRTLVYEDCRRNIELTLGSHVMRELEPPLHLLLTSIRWFTQHIAAHYRKALLKTYVALAQKQGSVPFSEFWLEVQSMLTNKEEFSNSLVRQQFQEHWQNILQISYDQHQVTYSSAQLHEQVTSRFQATAPGWKSARHHSPDLLIQAESVEEINKGNYQVILGEFHVAMNTLEAMTFRYSHTQPEKLLQAIAADIPTPRIFPMYAKATLPITRTRPSLITDKDFLFLYSADTYAPANEKRLLASELQVEFTQGRLIVRTLDGSKRFDILDFFAEFMAEIACSTFSLHKPARHIPRVTIDRLVISRETWTFSAGELEFSSKSTPLERFLGARRWSQTYSIPRFIFIKVPSEEKPYFVDLESSIYVDNFSKLVRLTTQAPERSQTITISEMLPEPDKLWLTDNEGLHYTSELRCVLVD